MSPNDPPGIDMDAVHDLAHQPRNGLARPLRDRAPAPPIKDGNGRAPAGNESRDIELSSNALTSLPVPRLGAEAAEHMTRLSKAAADDIRRLGQLAFQAGQGVQDECEQMARDVESNAGAIAQHLTGLSQLLADVGMSNRETLHRLRGDVSPSIVPSTGSGHATKTTSSVANPPGEVPFGKPGRRERYD